MSYQIPQQLEYKEKIMFGLNFKQLAYMFIFVPIIILIFFKSNVHIALKIPLMAMFAGLAIGFMFLDLDKHLRNWYFWYKSKKIESCPKLSAIIPIKEVKNQLIITKDNNKLAVIKITPINFSIKPDESKNAIAIAFQKFLNSIDFPIQIMINTEHLNLQEYFSEVKKKVSNLEPFKRLFEGYKKHLELITNEKDVMNRVFYIIIPEKTDINIQLQICQSKLANIGLKNIRLNDKELTLLLKNFFMARPKKMEEQDVQKENK